VILPLALIGLAILSAGVMAYGTEPAWAQYPHGIEFIMLSRRLEWPLVSISILLCIALIALVVAGKKRAWFLIGLGPVVALFAHRFTTQPAGAGIADGPAMVAPAEAPAIAPDDYVVGLSFQEDDFAFPYAALFETPVVMETDHDRRFLLIWSAYANRAVAMSIGHDLKARDLEIVSSPANSLLLYNGRLGQFINGVTGRTSKGEKPAGCIETLPTWKMTWKRWLDSHPRTKVLPLPQGVPPIAPSRPILPGYPLPKLPLDRPADTPIAMVGDAHPLALERDSIGAAPINLDVDSIPVFLTRESKDQPLIAFDRRLTDDLRPKFELVKTRRVRGAMFLDSDTDSSWTAQGAWLAGLKELKGKKLSQLPVDDGLYWGVMQFWYPRLTFVSEAKIDQIAGN
jgi:hypothetical protein